MCICMGFNTIYCSSVKLTNVAYNTGVVAAYLSQMMKSCSIMTGLLFSLQRYVTNS